MASIKVFSPFCINNFAMSNLWSIFVEDSYFLAFFITHSVI